MWRKFTVYGLRFSKTCFWNRINTGFLDPAVATVLLTACGMRRRVRGSRGAKRRWGPHISSPWLKGRENKGDEVTVPTACGIETDYSSSPPFMNSSACCNSAYRLRYWNGPTSMLPLMVALLFNSTYRLRYWNSLASLPLKSRTWWVVATVPTACGIETIECLHNTLSLYVFCCNSTYRLRYWNMYSSIASDHT